MLMQVDYILLNCNVTSKNCHPDIDIKGMSMMSNLTMNCPCRKNFRYKILNYIYISKYTLKWLNLNQISSLKLKSKPTVILEFEFSDP